MSPDPQQSLHLINNHTINSPLNLSLMGSGSQDILYHFGISKNEEGLCDKYGGIKFVIVGGSAKRLHKYARMFSEETQLELSENLSKTDRYGMWKTGPVLWINHGMGVPSMSIMLIETIKLLLYAGASGFQFIRVGTSGGVGIPPGTVVISTAGLNGALEQKHIQYINGEMVKRDATLDKGLNKGLFETAKAMDIPVDRGLSFCTDDFYEGQMRMNGLFCDYTEGDKLKFLHKLHQMGVKNIEMEATGFAAITHRAGVPGAVMCVTLLNRMESDLVSLSPEHYQEFELRPFKIVCDFIKKHLK